MNDDWRSRNNLSGRDALKAAAAIMGLLIGCILLVWVTTRLLRPSARQSSPDSPRATQSAK
jgi:hypothetical protein